MHRHSSVFKTKPFLLPETQSRHLNSPGPNQIFHINFPAKFVCDATSSQFLIATELLSLTFYFLFHWNCDHKLPYTRQVKYAFCENVSCWMILPSPAIPTTQPLLRHDSLQLVNWVTLLQSCVCFLFPFPTLSSPYSNLKLKKSFEKTVKWIYWLLKVDLRRRKLDNLACGDLLHNNVLPTLQVQVSSLNLNAQSYSSDVECDFGSFNSENIHVRSRVVWVAFDRIFSLFSSFLCYKFIFLCFFYSIKL